MITFGDNYEWIPLIEAFVRELASLAPWPTQ